ncbi:hypothetical protein [Pseudomonas alabamensis]|uniref:hypothetical protein n=1 Tax=Pseudomonas alabamensis TaxID=3064349 RepID=UPI0011A0A1ED
MEFNSIRDTVCSCIVGCSEEKLDADQIAVWMADVPDQCATLEQVEQRCEWLRERNEADDYRLSFNDLADVIEGVETFAKGRDAGIVLAYDFLQNNKSLLGGSDLWETTISEPCPKVLARLYYVRHAAKLLWQSKSRLPSPDPALPSSALRDLSQFPERTGQPDKDRYCNQVPVVCSEAFKGDGNARQGHENSACSQCKNLESPHTSSLN